MAIYVHRTIVISGQSSRRSFTPNIQSSKQLYINGKPSGNAQAVNYTRTNVTGWSGYQDYGVSITNNMANSAKEWFCNIYTS